MYPLHDGNEDEMKQRKRRKIKAARNFVAKHMNTFNKPKVETDRKKRSKDGYEKHRGSYEDC